MADPPNSKQDRGKENDGNRMIRGTKPSDILRAPPPKLVVPPMDPSAIKQRSNWITSDNASGLAFKPSGSLKLNSGKRGLALIQLAASQPVTSQPSISSSSFRDYKEARSHQVSVLESAGGKPSKLAETSSQVYTDVSSQSSPPTSQSFVGRESETRPYKPASNAAPLSSSLETVISHTSPIAGANGTAVLSSKADRHLFANKPLRAAPSNLDANGDISSLRKIEAATISPIPRISSTQTIPEQEEPTAPISYSQDLSSQASDEVLLAQPIVVPVREAAQTVGCINEVKQQAFKVPTQKREGEVAADTEGAKMSSSTLESSVRCPAGSGWRGMGAARSAASASMCFALESAVTSVALSPDGMYVVTGCADGMIRLFDMGCTLESDRSGIVLGQIEAKGLHTNLIMQIEITKNGKYCFAGVRKGSSEMLVFDLQHYKILKERRGFASTSGLRVFRHSDAKLKGFGAVCMLRQDSTTASQSQNSSDCSEVYRLLCGLGIKNLHVWTFTFCGTEEPVWNCIYDEQTNGNTIQLVAFTKGGHGAYSRSDGKAIRYWDLSKPWERPVPGHYVENTKSKEILLINNDIGIGGSDHAEFVNLLTGQPTTCEFPQESSGSSKRRRCMLNVVSVAAVQGASTALFLCSNGVLYQCQGYGGEQCKLSHLNLPSLRPELVMDTVLLMATVNENNKDHISLITAQDCGGEKDGVLKIEPWSMLMSMENDSQSGSQSSECRKPSLARSGACWWCKDPRERHWEEQEEESTWSQMLEEGSDNEELQAIQKELRAAKSTVRQSGGGKSKSPSSSPPTATKKTAVPKKRKSDSALTFPKYDRAGELSSPVQLEVHDSSVPGYKAASDSANNMHRGVNLDTLLAKERERWRLKLEQRSSQLRKKHEEKMREVTQEADRRFMEEKRLRKEWNATEAYLTSQLRQERDKVAEAEAKEAATRSELSRLTNGGSENMKIDELNEITASLLEGLRKNAHLKELCIEKLEPNKCVICKDRIAETAIVPCGHLCLCEEDAARLHSSGVKRCPVCQGPRASVLKIYYP